MNFNIEVVQNRKQEKDFIDMAYQVYEDNSNWIPPLRSLILRHIRKNNPFYENGIGKSFIVRQGSKVVGRVLAHVSWRHKGLHHEKVGYFGLFECINQFDVAKLLMESAESFLGENNCDVIRGPFNITAAQEIGFLLEGFDETPAIDMVYTAPWYPDFFKRMGYQTCLKMKTFRNDQIGKLDLSSCRIQPSDPKIKIRSLNSLHRRRDMENIRELVNCAFLGNWNFVPITRKEWDFQVGEMISVLDPDIVVMAERDGIPIGVSLTVPDYNRVMRHTNGALIHPASIILLQPHLIQHAVVILFAVRKQYQGQGVGKAINAYLIEQLKKKGYQSLSITWIADENLSSLAQTKLFEMTALHRLAMFEKRL